MRPKKRILLIDSDDDRRGRLSFLLRVKGYATSECADRTIDLIIAQWPSQADYRALKDLCQCSIIFLGEKKDAGLLIDGETVHGPRTSDELLSIVRIRTARKRGPKKGYRKPPQTATPEPAAEAATA